MSKKTLKPVVLAASAALLGSMALSTSAFAMDSLAQGYLLSAGDHKGEEGKCGEGKCGSDKAEEGKCGEGKCGSDKAEEGKCGGNA